MPLWSFVEVERVVRASWGADTCDPADLDNWHPGNPAKGQCGTTALVLHDLFGGVLMLGEVHVAGSKVGWHYWNRFGAELEIDLTREQFGPDELVIGGKTVERPSGPPRRCAEQYDILRERVMALLYQAAQSDR
jgi:hypothetical protein